ncbi:MBL fold metallo-hydrolase [Bacillus marasmi]|uniref:MBL fold metallo-hydrolase n=1 Tax=Bacillus marasmi TaxID=1926279 RepID=UPI0011C74BDF|nr:MBL fold metallo-hydrolase [Bacillus marasmi]
MTQKLIKFSNHLYYLTPSHVTDRPVLGAIVGKKHVLMVDGGNSPNHVELFLRELEKQGVKPPSLVLLTHWHWDHIFGLSELSIPIIAQNKTIEKIKYLSGLSWDLASLNYRVQTDEEISFCADMMKKEYGESIEQIQVVHPTIGFNKELYLDLGDLSCRIEHVGGDHAEDSTIIYIEEERFMFLGDSTSCDIYAKKRKYTAGKLIPLMNRLEEYEAEWYLHSHTDAPITRQQFIQENQECRAIMNSIHKLGRDFLSIEQEVQSVFGRELTEDDKELLRYFLNGYEA